MPKATRTTRKITPTAMPALAPVLRPEEVDAEEDDADEDAIDVGEEIAVLLIVLVLELVPEDAVEAGFDVEEAVLEVAVPVMELEELAALSNTCGAGAGQVSSVGFAQSIPFAYDHEQHAQRPVSGL
jgi:hypothetical protein